MTRRALTHAALLATLSAALALPALAQAPGTVRFPERTYRVRAVALDATASHTVSIESSAAQGFRLIEYCVSSSPATAAAVVTVTVQRRTTAASSGGTALTADGTGATTISRLDQADVAFPGIARLDGTPGTAGAVLDGFTFVVGELGAGAADPPGDLGECYDFSAQSRQVPRAAKGVTNGISITVSAAGAGAQLAASIRATIALVNE